MGTVINFFEDTEENRRLGKNPLSTNIKKMSWNGASSSFNLKVEFFNGGIYEYDVNNIPCPFKDAEENETYKDYFSRVGGTSSAIWLDLIAGSRWTKASMIKGEMPDRRSTGSAFHYLIRKPAGYDRKLYRKVDN